MFTVPSELLKVQINKKEACSVWFHRFIENTGRLEYIQNLFGLYCSCGVMFVSFNTKKLRYHRANIPQLYLSSWF